MNIQDQAKAIVVGKGSKASKKAALIKLGLRPIDADTLFIVYAAELAAAQRENRQPNIDTIIAGLTFGVELECINAPVNATLEAVRRNGLNINYEGYNHRDRANAFKLVTDSSIHGDNPIECVSPILSGSASGFASLKSCTEALQSIGAGVNRSTGTHVHIGYPNIGGEHYVNIFKNYQKLERVIDSFMAESRRRNRSTWCHSLAGYDFSSCHSVEQVREKLNYDRYFKVNAEAYSRHQTIEFRQHQGTLSYEKISMWVRFCLKLVVWSKDNVLTEIVLNVNEIPFLNAEEKRFFNDRVAELSGRA